MNEMREFIGDLVSGCDYGTEELSPAMRERAEKIICGGDVLEKTIEDIRGKIKDIDTALLREMLALKKCNREICAALGISTRKLQYMKKELN